MRAYCTRRFKYASFRCLARCNSTQAAWAEAAIPDQRWRGPASISLFRVPAGLTRVELIKALMPMGSVGRILGIHVSTQTHIPSECKAIIEFDTREELRRLVQLLGQGKLNLGGRTSFGIRHSFNASLTPSWQLVSTKSAGGIQPRRPPMTQLPSRVLRILGPSNLSIMNEPALTNLFDQRSINLETEFVSTKDVEVEGPTHPLQRVIEWHFCDWATQARHAYTALKEVDGILVTYGLDPCAKARPTTITPLLPRGLHFRKTVVKVGPPNNARHQLAKETVNARVEIDATARPVHHLIGTRARLGREAQTEDEEQSDHDAESGLGTTAEAQVQVKHHQQPGNKLVSKTNPLQKLEEAVKEKLSAEKGREDSTHPDLDSWVRALVGETQQQEQERAFLQKKDMPRAPQSDLSRPKVPAAPAPKLQDPPHGSPVESGPFTGARAVTEAAPVVAIQTTPTIAAAASSSVAMSASLVSKTTTIDVGVRPSTAVASVGATTSPGPSAQAPWCLGSWFRS